MVIATQCNIFMAMRNTLHVKFEFDLFRCGEAPRQEVIWFFLKLCKDLTFRREIISTSDLYATSCFLQSKSQLPIKYYRKCFVLPMLQCPIPRDTVRTVQFISCNEPCCSQRQTPYSEPITKAKALSTCRNKMVYSWQDWTPNKNQTYGCDVSNSFIHWQWFDQGKR